MLLVRYNVQVDMRDDVSPSPILDGVQTRPYKVVSVNHAYIAMRTATGGMVAVRGRFDRSSEDALLGSPVTGYIVYSRHNEILMDIRGFTGITLDQFERLTEAQLIARFLAPAEGGGYEIRGSPFDDILLGLSGSDTINGGAGSDILRGSGGNDTLVGSSGNDSLEGGAGADTMSGGAGNDNYLVDSLADRVVDGHHAGNDTVRSSVSFVLGNDIENLQLVGNLATNGTGNPLDNILIGNAAGNVMKGLAGNDLLDGGRGADRLEGGTGNDTYIIDSRRDVIVEKAGAGNDTVKSSFSFTLGTHFDDLTLLGDASLYGVGNSLDNVLRGNSGDNRLSGGDGADTLLGGAGHDVLTGGAGADHFVLADSGDAISDFLSGIDQLGLDADFFTALTPGALDSTQFRDSATPADFNDFLVYDSASGVLSYDASGSGAGLQTVVSLGLGTVLLASDIVVV